MAAKRRCDAEGLWAVPAAARRGDCERRRAAAVDGSHRLTRVVSPRSARRPSPLVTMRCARACGDIRSGVTGGSSDGGGGTGAERWGSGGGASSVTGLEMAGVLVREGARRSRTNGAAGQAARRVDVLHGLGSLQDGRYTEGGGGGEM
jgi:hypothetical protein